ncbi:cytochrome c biogenesis protein ResB [Demetria terragena]|uniref:cytochrome c biogenesis protein ResB n=1 Tax=Demetria terragena TaxID=63959 RepID=UPI00035D0728|nr:cytochrome c biogenesis protein ResB [Demetria terragena]
MSDKKSAKRRELAPSLGVIGTARWFWRQLTSMRTALFLLLMLAVAALPGSIWPQRRIDAARVADYLDRHPDLGPWLDKFGFFDVYASPWFSAIYLLLVVSLLGCILPRMRQQWKSARAQVPVAPKRLSRLEAYATTEVEATQEEALDAARNVLGKRRFRLREGEGWLSGEVGLGREIGNLVFHVGLVCIIVSVALGHLFGWRGDVIVTEGESFASTAGRYDTLDPGPWVDSSSLPAWSLKLNKLKAEFEDGVPPGSSQYGQPRGFDADVTTEDEQGTKKQSNVSPNHPTGQDGSSIYLLGNGYAPKITVRDKDGKVMYQQATPFLPQDNVYKSTGAVKVAGASPEQLGFFGFFIPSLDFDEKQGPYSTFPGLNDPALVLGLYEGDLFPQGRPQSVYTLDTKAMKQVRAANGEPLRLLVRPGQTVDLPGDRGSITFEKGIPRWGGLSVRRDPGKIPALVSAMVGLGGLIASLVLRRRRVFVRVKTDPEGGRTLVEVGGMVKNHDPRLESAIEQYADDIAGSLRRTGTKP